MAYHAKLNLLEQNLLNELLSLSKFGCVFKITNVYFVSQFLKGQNIVFSKSGLDFCFYTLVLAHLVIHRVGKEFSLLSLNFMYLYKYMCIYAKICLKYNT